MAGKLAFDECSGRVFGLAAPNRPSLAALHNLPDGIRRQVHLANDTEGFGGHDALVVVKGLPRLQWRRVHEVLGLGRLRFALITAKQARLLSKSHPTIIIGASREVYALRPESLGAFVPPASVTLIEAGRRSERLWAAEQALAAKARAIVILHMDQGPNLSESRSLQIAAERGGSLGIVLIAGRARSSACQTRWVCDPVADGWNWSLTKNKTGRVGAWRIREGPDGTLFPIPLSSLNLQTHPSSHEPAPHSASVVSLPAARPLDPSGRPSA